MSSDAIVIAILKNQITCEGRPVELPPRERALLFAVAASSGPLPCTRAQTAVWPDLSAERGANVLWVTLHRLRKRFGGHDVVRSGPIGYALAPEVYVDVAEAHRLAEAFRHGRSSLEKRSRALDLVIDAAGAEDALGELPEYVTSRAREAIEDLTEALARDARSGADEHWSLEVARAQWRIDPANEEACERVIRGWLSLGDRGSAIGTYRKHSRVLHDELDLEPSPHLLELVRI